jgi:hypothetical protein
VGNKWHGCGIGLTTRQLVVVDWSEMAPMSSGGEAMAVRPQLLWLRWGEGESGCRMDLPGPTTSVGTRTDYSVGPWDYPTCATWHLMAWGTRATEEKYSVRKLYMSRTVWKTPRRTRLVLSPYSDL